MTAKQNKTPLVGGKLKKKKIKTSADRIWSCIKAEQKIKKGKKSLRDNLQKASMINTSFSSKITKQDNQRICRVSKRSQWKGVPKENKGHSNTSSNVLLVCERSSQSITETQTGSGVGRRTYRTKPTMRRHKIVFTQKFWRKFKTK